MRTIALGIAYCTVLIGICTAPCASQNQAPPAWLNNVMVNTSVQNQTLPVAIDQIFKSARVKYKVLPQLPTNCAISTSFSNVPLGMVLDMFLPSQGLKYFVDRDVVVIDAATPGGAIGLQMGGTGMSSGVMTSGSAGGMAGGGAGGGGWGGASAGVSGGSGDCQTSTSTTTSTSSGSMTGSGVMPGFMGTGSNIDVPQWLADIRVNNNIQNLPFNEAIEKLLRDAGVNYRFTSPLPQSPTISLSYNNVPLAGALESALRNQGFAFHVEGNVIVIEPMGQTVDKTNPLIGTKTVTTSISSLPLAGAIGKLLSDAGVNYRILPALPEVTYTLNYNNVPLSQALESLLRQNGLTCYVQGDTLIIDWPQK